MANEKFHWADYVVFALMLLGSAAVGIFFAYYKKDESTEQQQQQQQQQMDKTKNKPENDSADVDDYLHGRGQMKVFPVAMSLVGSYVSAVTILGTVSEIYYFGTQYWMIIIAIYLMAVVVATVYLPVFVALRVNSSYEYLEMRFSPAVRSFASIMFVMDEIFFLPFVLYVPAIALSQVTGVNLHIISIASCVFCVIYTLVGGIKAVVNVDAWQIIIMFFSIIVVVICGLVYSKDIGDIFAKANEGGRLILANINPSLYERQTLWAVLIGGFSYWLSFNSVNQTMVEHYMTLPSLRKAQLAVGVFTIGITGFISLCCFLGLMVFHVYRKCDPYLEGIITRTDQILPAYVMRIAGKLHGIPGLFVAGIFGASLSSLSVVLHATSLVILEDIIKGLFRVNIKERTAKYVVKICMVTLGCIAIALVFVLERLSGILSVSTAVTAIAAGTTCGLFSLGMLVPWCNNIGAIVGGVAGAMLSGWIAFGTQIAIAFQWVVPHKLEVINCANNKTITYQDESNVFPLNRLSFHWINPIGVCTTLIIGTIVSFLSKPRDIKTLDANLISPILHRCLPKECFAPKDEKKT